MKLTLKAATALALAVPFSATLMHAQMTGVSHPEEVPITTSSEGIAQPIVYTPTPAPAAATLKVRTAETLTAEKRPVLTASAAGPQTAMAETAGATSVADDDGPVRPFLTSTPGAGDNIVSRVAGSSNELPVGTMLRVKLSKELTTKVTSLGTEFTGELAEAVRRDGRVLLPAGSILTGRVAEVHGGRRISGSASIRLQPEAITLPDGQILALRGQVIDSELYGSTRVNKEGTIVRKDHAAKTAGAFAIATGSGAAAGAVFGGWPGALIGAGIGAGVSTVVWLKQDRQTELPVGTRLVFALTRPMVFSEN